jgi:hypothetical protein
MTDRRDPIERTIEVLVYAPLGLGLYLKDVAPSFVEMFVARGRAEVDRRQQDVAQRVTTARSMGQVAMAFGFPLLRERVQRQANEARSRAGGWLEQTGLTPREQPPARREPPARRAPPPPPRPPVAHANGDAAAPAASELPIPGYDALSASQVVERLPGLGHDDLEAVRAYESTHRNRRTILGKIEQLAG